MPKLQAEVKCRFAIYGAVILPGCNAVHAPCLHLYSSSAFGLRRLFPTNCITHPHRQSAVWRLLCITPAASLLKSLDRCCRHLPGLVEPGLIVARSVGLRLMTQLEFWQMLLNFLHMLP